MSTGCLIFVKISVGVRVSASLVSHEYQFGFFSADQTTNIVDAFLSGNACLELRYARIPFFIVVEPLCEICVGLFGCGACSDCLSGILASLTVEFMFGAQQTAVLWTTCNEGGTSGLLNAPPSGPSPPHRPPDGPSVPTELVDCHGHHCNTDAECAHLGPLWVCYGGSNGWASSGQGDGDCYNMGCDVPPSPPPPTLPRLATPSLPPSSPPSPALPSFTFSLPPFHPSPSPASPPRTLPPSPTVECDVGLGRCDGDTSMCAQGYGCDSDAFKPDSGECRPCGCVGVRC